MSAKQILSIIGVVAVLLAIAIGLALFGQKEGQAPVADKSPILGGVATSTNAYEYVDDAPYYTVDAVYPRKTLLADLAADAKARTTMEQSIAADIAQFKTDGNFANLTAEDIQTQGLGADRKYALGFTYDEYQGSSTVSYVFLVYEDTLGAHPNAFYKTFTFDMQGNSLELGDLFLPAQAGTPNSSYLTVLSAPAYKDVVAQLTQKSGSAPDSGMLETVRMGTEPSPEALQFYYISGVNLHLLFPPYQVAAYAAGTFDVSIPLASLSSILKSEYK